MMMQYLYPDKSVYCLVNVIYLEMGVVLTTLVVLDKTVITFKNVVTDDILFGVVTKCDVERVYDVVVKGVTNEALKSIGPTKIATNWSRYSN
jgi:hypothetical protein